MMRAGNLERVIAQQRRAPANIAGHIQPELIYAQPGLPGNAVQQVAMPIFNQMHTTKTIIHARIAIILTHPPLQIADCLEKRGGHMELTRRLCKRRAHPADRPWLSRGRSVLTSKGSRFKSEQKQY